jgi:hypothetical protein
MQRSLSTNRFEVHSLDRDPLQTPSGLRLLSAQHKRRHHLSGPQDSLLRLKRRQLPWQPKSRTLGLWHRCKPRGLSEEAATTRGRSGERSAWRGTHSRLFMISIQSHHFRPEYQLTNRDDVDENDPHVERDDGKVDQLCSRPKAPVHLESRPPSAVQLILGVVGVSTLKDGHSRNERGYTNRR